MKRLITALAALIAITAIADFAPYNGTVRIWAESDGLFALHYHDWSERPSKLDVDELDLPVSSTNYFAYVELWDRKAGKLLWRNPTTAFSNLWMSPDGKYIVGMSDIMIANPYQLVVFDRKGVLLLREHVTALKAKFTEDELSSFWKKYPKAKLLLESHTKKIEGKFYVDFMVIGMSNALSEDVWRALHDKAVENPEFPWVSESTTNWVYWYNRGAPDLAIVEKNGKTYLEFESPGPPQSSGAEEPKRVQIEIPKGPEDTARKLADPQR